MRKIFNKEKGFTLLEIIATLVVMGILAAIAVSRATNFTTEVYAGADTLRTSLRYAQTTAMNTNSSVAGLKVWGINYDSGANQYWLFKDADANNINNIALLPEGAQYATTARKINLNAKRIKFTAAFTIYFDDRGIPYTAYIDATNNTPLANNLIINVQPLNSAAPNIAVTITPLTGYIQ